MALPPIVIDNANGLRQAEIAASTRLHVQTVRKVAAEAGSKLAFATVLSVMGR